MEPGQGTPNSEGNGEWRPLLIDTKGREVAPDRVWVRRSPVGYVCVALGRSAKLAQLALENSDKENSLGAACRRLDRAIAREGHAKAERLGIEIPFDAIDEAPLRRLAIASALVKAGFDPNESRDDHGEWTSGASGAAAARTAQSLAREASLFGRVAPSVLAGLARLAATVGAGATAAASAFLGVIFITTNRSLISEGTIPGQPDLRFKYDAGEGALTIYRDGDGRSLGFTAKPGPDGVFRDEEGRAIARLLDGSLIMDPNALPGAGTGPGIGENQPQLCPDPGADKPGAREKDIAYQGYVSLSINPDSPLSPGLAVRLWNADTGKYVYFDDCRQEDGTMVEAKGAYLHLMEKDSEYPWKGAEDKMVKQAQRQLDAAQGRRVEWYFKEEEVANHMRDVFLQKNLNINVYWLPSP